MIYLLSGTSIPPLHPWRRSTTIAVIDGAVTDGLRRRAKDPETGKYVEVPADMTYKQWKKDVDNGGRSGIIKSGAISGARNPYGAKAKEHAKKYYGLVRSMKTDVSKIAKITGFKESKIQEVKDFIFNEVHDLGNGQFERFEPDYMMTESWKRLIDGIPRSHDITMINHEIMERELMKQGYNQSKAHILTSKKYNYDKEATEFYDKIKKYKD